MSEIEESIDNILSYFSYLLPVKKTASIFLKPNLNNDMIALTGGTTDLRIIVAVIKALKKRGYNNITIGDGSNSGAYYNKIDVMQRLKIKDIADKFNAKTIDLNRCPSRTIDFKKTHVANICLDAEFFINLPTIKTHTEAEFSCALKNMVGCLQGLNKRNVHWNLAEGILAINDYIKPDLHIVDGLIVMEGNGPSQGTPKRLDRIWVGTNPYVLDMTIAKLVGFDNVTYLKKLNLPEQKEIMGIKQRYELKKPKHHPVINILLKNYFVLPRYWLIFKHIFDSKLVGKLLVAFGIRQDDFLDKDAFIKEIYSDKKFKNLKVFEKYCPLK